MQQLSCKFIGRGSTFFASPLLRVQYLKFFFNNHSDDCIRFEFFGEKAPVCPHGSARHLDKCYMASQSQDTHDKAMQFCKEGFYWKSEGYLARPKDELQLRFVYLLSSSK